MHMWTSFILSSLEELLLQNLFQLAVRTTDQTKYSGNLLWDTYKKTSLNLTDYPKRLYGDWKETKHILFNVTDVTLPRKLPAPRLTLKVFHIIFTKNDIQD